MTKHPYLRNKRHDREKTIYGICINKRNGKHYCFNRDYFVLPVELPSKVVAMLKEISTGHHSDGTAGRGRFLPKISNHEEWETFWLFDDKNSPNWTQESFEYDKSFYENK